MILVRAVAEIEPEDIGSGVEQGFDGLAAGAGRTEGCDDFGVSIAAHL
jgi:hypothetical protein